MTKPKKYKNAQLNSAYVSYLENQLSRIKIIMAGTVKNPSNPALKEIKRIITI